jgi:hypothetical protein
MFRNNYALWPSFSNDPTFHALIDTFAVVQHTNTIDFGEDNNEENSEEDNNEEYNSKHSDSGGSIQL